MMLNTLPKLFISNKPDPRTSQPGDSAKFTLTPAVLQEIELDPVELLSHACWIQIRQYCFRLLIPEDPSVIINDMTFTPTSLVYYCTGQPNSWYISRDVLYNFY